MKDQKGFTLVEIAIVLVIIGFLLGGILKGSTFINNAKTTNVINQAKSLSAAVYGYQAKYNYLPGDDPKATRWSGSTAGNGDGQISESEKYQALTHLSEAELITGSYDEQSPMNHKFNGEVNVVWTESHGREANAVMFDNLPSHVAEQMDTTLDDGKPDEGGVRIDSQSYDDEDKLINETIYFF